MNTIFQNKLEIRKLCTLHSVKYLYVFGSVTNENFSKQSDIDMIVVFNEVRNEEYAKNYFNFQFSLEALFKREVDLLEEEAIKNPYFKEEIIKSRILIYEQ